MIFTYILIILGLFGFWRTLIQYRDNKVSKHWLLLWNLAWLTMIAVALFPQSTDKLASLIGVGRGADLIVYISIIFFLYMLSRILTTQEKLRKEITDLTREIAIDNAKKPE